MIIQMKNFLIIISFIWFAEASFGISPPIEANRVLEGALKRRIDCEKKSATTLENVHSLEEQLKSYKKTSEEVQSALVSLAPKQQKELIRSLVSAREHNIFYVAGDAKTRNLLEELSMAYVQMDSFKAACAEIQAIILMLQPNTPGHQAVKNDGHDSI